MRTMLALLLFLFAGGFTLAAETTPVAASKPGDTWPLFRGDALASGVARSTLPAELERLWTFEVPKGAFDSTPVIVGDRVYLGDLDGTFFCLNLADGKKVWEFKTKDKAGFSASPAYRNGKIYVGDIDGRFYCLDAAKGEKLWEYESKAEINSSANFHKDRVLFGSQDAVLYCLDAEKGTKVWEFAIQDQIRCSPTVVEDRAFVAGCDGKLHIVDLNKGEEVGEGVPIESPTGSTPAVLGTRVYFGTEGGTFFCIDWKEAKVIWSYTDDESNQPYRSSAAATDDLIIVGGRNKRVKAFNPANGEEKWTFVARNRIDASPVVVGDRIFIGAGDGRLYGLNRKDGKKVWEYEAGGGFTGSPAVAEGRMVVATDRGVVLCFGKK